MRTGIWRSIKGIVLGILVDRGATFLIQVFYMFLVFFVFAMRKVPKEDWERLLREPSLALPGMFLGLACTVLGGYIAGKIAGRAGMLHGAIMAVPGFVIGFNLSDSFPPWYNVISLTFIIPMGMLGGLIAQQKLHAQTDQAMTRMSR
jgi:hypothetical protein